MEEVSSVGGLAFVRRFVSVPVTLVFFSSEDRETEHGKFINCKLSLTDSVGCTYNKYS